MTNQENRQKESQKKSRRWFLKGSGGLAAALIGGHVFRTLTNSKPDENNHSTRNIVEPDPTPEHLPAPETKPPKTVEELIRIDPATYPFVDGRTFEGVVNVEPDQDKPIIVHFGQYHGLDFVTNILLKNKIIAAQKAIAQMITDAKITDVFDEGCDTNLQELLQLLLSKKKSLFDTLAPGEEGLNQIMDAYYLIQDNLISGAGFDPNSYDRIMTKNSYELDFFNINEVLSALDYLLVETVRRLNGGELPEPNPDIDPANISATDWLTIFVYNLSHVDSPYAQIGATAMLFLEEKIQLHPAETDDNLAWHRSLGNEMMAVTSELESPDLSESRRKELNDELEKLNKEYEYKVLEHRENGALANIKYSSVLKDDAGSRGRKVVGLVFGAAHDFTDEFRDLYDGGEGLITIKPESE